MKVIKIVISALILCSVGAYLALDEKKTSNNSSLDSNIETGLNQAKPVVAPVSIDKPEPRPLPPPNYTPKMPEPEQIKTAQVVSYELERGKQLVPPPPIQPGHARSTRYDQVQADFSHGHEHHNHSRDHDMPPPQGVVKR